jgi:hypothetical protein
MTAVHQAYMLDANVFNDVLDGNVLLPPFIRRHLLLVTGIQPNELRATRNPERRAALLAVYEEISPTPVPASSLAFDIEGAGFDQAYWNDGSGNFEKMFARLQVLDKKPGKKKNDSNQMRDTLIAETAIKNGAILITGDSNLRIVVSEFGGQAIVVEGGVDTF